MEWSWTMSFTESVKLIAPVGEAGVRHLWKSACLHSHLNAVHELSCQKLKKKLKKWKILAKHPNCLNISLSQKKGNHYKRVRSLKSLSESWAVQIALIQETKPLFLPQILRAGSAAEELRRTRPENRNADKEPQHSVQVIRHLPV